MTKGKEGVFSQKGGREEEEEEEKEEGEGREREGEGGGGEKQKMKVYCCLYESREKCPALCGGRSPSEGRQPWDDPFPSTTGPGGGR